MDELTEAGKRGNGETRRRQLRGRAVAQSRKALGSPDPVSRIPAPGSLFGERGSALATVLVLVVLLTVAGAVMVNSTLTETSIAYNQSDSAAAQYAAEAGLSRAMYELSQNAGWTGTTAAIGDGQYVVTVASSGSVRSITSTGTRGGGRRVLKAAFKAIPQSASTTVLANTTATIGSATTGLTVRNDFPSSAASAVQANNKLAAATAMTVNTTGANIIGGLTANGTISGVTCGIWAWTCNVSATVRAIPEIDMDSAATTSLKYRAQPAVGADGKSLYLKGGDTGRCNSGGAWTFDATHTQQCWDYYVNSKSGTIGQISGVPNPVFYVEFNASETTSYSTGGGGGGSITPNLPIVTRGKSRAGISGSGTLTVNKPTGVVSGDLLIAAISVRAAAPATPSGWTLIWCQYSSSGSGSGGSTCPGATPTVSLAVYRKVAGASEPASYSWTVANKAEGIISAYYNVDTSNPIDATAQCILSAAASAGATSLSVVSGCTIGTGDSIVVGTNTTLNTVSAVSGTTLTISPGLGSGQSSGAAVVPQNGLSQTSTSSTSLSTPSITTHGANTMMVASFADGAGNTGFGTGVPGGIPADMSEENEGSSGGTPTSSIAHAGIFDGIKDAIGATGQKTVTLTSAGVGVAHLLALKPQTATVSTSSGGSAPTFRAAASNSAAIGNPLTISTPAGVVNGDVMIANITAVAGSSGTVAAPAGWNLIRRTTNDAAVDTTYVEQAVYYKVAAGEGASYTFTAGASQAMAGGISAYSGVDTTNPVDVENAVWVPALGNAANMSFPAPSVVTTNANDMLVASFVAWTSGGPPPPLNGPAGMNSRYSAAGTADALGADAIVATPGLTTAIRATAGTSSRGRGIGHLLALKPAGGTTVSCPGYTSAVETLCIRATAASPYPNSVLTQVTGAIVVFRCTLVPPPCYGNGSSAVVKGDIVFQNIASAIGNYTHSSLTGDPALIAAGQVIMNSSGTSAGRSATNVTGIIYTFAGTDNPSSGTLQGVASTGVDVQHGANSVNFTVNGIIISNGIVSLQDTGGSGTVTVRYDSTVANNLPAAFTASTGNYILIPISWSSGD